MFITPKRSDGVLALPVTFSAGVASCGGESRGWEALVREADDLLYRAKAGGKDQIASAGPEGTGRKSRSALTESV